jgi:L-threonylcarbamoyladenylate synthase
MDGFIQVRGEKPMKSTRFEILFKLSPKTYNTNPEYPEAEIIQEASALVKSGGVIAFPTRCLYGLGADAFNAEAADRIYEIKRRPTHKPILILIHHPIQLKQLVRNVSPTASRIMDHFWPGRVTLVFEALSAVPEYLTAGTGKIGVRQPGHPVAAGLVKAFQGPVTGTSANLSGAPGCHQIADLDPRVARRLDLILDAGPLKGGSGSTVVDVTADIPRILRVGQIGVQEILALGKAQTY